MEAATSTLRLEHEIDLLEVDLSLLCGVGVEAPAAPPEHKPDTLPAIAPNDDPVIEPFSPPANPVPLPTPDPKRAYPTC